MDDKLSIQVNVADRYYPLKIDRHDEERIRKAAKMINDKVLQYKQRYAEKDVQDFLAMAALQYVIKYIELEDNRNIQPMLEELEVLQAELSDYLDGE